MFVMLVTGFKSFDEIDLQTMWTLPNQFVPDNFIEAFDVLAQNSKGSKSARERALFWSENRVGFTDSVWDENLPTGSVR
ncbi:MAG TPA: hypothetical protein VJ965_06970 [Anaerolineales bacterium]|nr:hypothetical protein [Anaerolineales bacterium]